MKTILIIEDDADVRESTAEILELAGYRVVQAANGRAGVEETRKAAPDLVLCDIMMPELDGYGVLHMLGRDPSTAEVPFIFLSAKAERTDVRKGMELGADDYLTKPFEESELLNAIESRLKRSELFRKGFDNDFQGFNRFMDQARGLEALKHLSAERRTRKVAARETLFHEGDDMRTVPYLVSGKVRTFKLNTDGKELATGLHKPGDLIGYMGLLENGQAQETAQAMEDCEVALVHREDLLALLYKDRDVSIRFIKMLAHDVKEKEQHLLQLAYSSVRQRVAQMILRVHDRFAGSGAGLGVKVNRDDLASIVGTATESMIRCLTEMKDEGIINTEGRDIVILDKTRLERVAHR